MLNFLTALKSKFTGSALSNDVGGRVYLDEAKQGAQFPYVVYSIVSGVPQDNFKTDLDDILLAEKRQKQNKTL